MENWRNIDGYGDIYQVSDIGRIRNVHKWNILNGSKWDNHYYIVNIMGKQHLEICRKEKRLQTKITTRNQLSKIFKRKE